MGLFMQKHRNKIILFMVGGGGLVLLYSFLNPNRIITYAPVRPAKDTIKSTSSVVGVEEGGRGVGLTPAEKLVGSLDHLVASGNNDTLEGGGTSDKESSPRPEESVGTKEKLPGKPYDSTMVGSLNFDFWRWVTGYTVDDLRISREFPAFPDERKVISQLHFDFHEIDKADVKGRYGHKVFGYLVPPSPGTYSLKLQFSQLTAAAVGELWISTDADPQGSHKVLTLSYDDQSRPVRRIPTEKSQEAANIKLSTVHYFEFLMKAYEGKAVADVTWKRSDAKNFEAIPKSSFALAFRLDKDGNPADKASADQFLKKPLPSNHLQTHHRIYSIINTVYPITDLNVLPQCEFSAQYAMRQRIKSYTGIHHVFESKVVTRDETWFKNWRKNDRGNQVMNQQLMKTVVDLYSTALNQSKEVNGEVVKLHYLEETANRGDGSRFLLEMEVELDDDKTVYTAEYVYLKSGSSQLCHTSNFQWTKNVDVYFIVTVRNLGYWVKHVIYNMEEIYEQTRDEHFALVIVDYGSLDMDIAAEANRSTFKRIHVLQMTGDFSRSGGLQAGIEYITDPNVILMTIDMHLTLPAGIVEYTRRHTVQHKMAFTPMFFRLNKGYTDVNWNGFWETLTYGLFAMYKDDWTTFGGFNTKKYKYKWGGEDWDILDRALAKGYEAFRIRPPGLTHYHHTKTGMWGNNDIKLATKFTLKYK